MAIKRKTRDDIENIAQSAITDAVSFVQSEISGDRIKAQRYYDGEVDLGYEEGRSKIVATKARDVVRAVKPSLMRVFLSTARPVEYVPSGPEDVAAAEQANAFMQHKFEQLDGFNILNDAFHDALVKKQGIVKAYWCMKEDAEIFTYNNLTDEEYAIIAAADDVEILEHSLEVEAAIDPLTGLEAEVQLHSMKISRKTETGDLVMEGVPPEEFFISKDAKSLEDAYVVAHQTDLRVGDLMAMGFKYEDVVGLDTSDGGTTPTDTEVQTRQGYQDTDDENELDPTMKEVTITEAYMRIDVDGTGVPLLHKLTCGGSNYKLLDYELCDELPFAKFESDPEPHSFYGNSLVDIVLDDQDHATAIVRSILDNVAMVNNPRYAVVDSSTGGANMDDVLNNEIGAVVRMKQQGAVQPLAVPFVAGQTLQALSYLDDMTQTKTGVSRASMGLDANALQSTTRVQAQATVQAGAATTEAMVRNLAAGMKDLFALMLRLYVKNTDEEQLVKMSGGYVPVDPRVWNADMDVTINVGLGTGREEEKMQALQMVLGLQQQTLQTFGLGNPLVSLSNMHNTVADLAAVNGLRNTERYFGNVTPEVERKMARQQAQQGQQGQAPDPTQAIIAAETIKGQVKMQSDAQKAKIDTAKAAADHQFKMEQLAVTDDRERDKMAQDFALQNAKLQSEEGMKVNEMALRAIQSAPRDAEGNI